MAIEPNRLREELRLMRQRIKEDPAVLAQFDADGNGVIDGEEWEQVRQLVIQRLEREAAETEAMDAAGAERPEQGHVTDAVMEEVARQNEPVPGSFSKINELVLRQEGGLGQVFEQMTRRNYQVMDRSSRVVANIQQSQSGMALNMKNMGHSLPADIDFGVACTLDGEKLRFRRSVQYAGGGVGGALKMLAGKGLLTRVGVMNDQGNEIAHARYEPALIGGKVLVYSTLQKNGLTIMSQPMKPFTFDILVGDRVIGRMERGWSGLGGFLSGGNQIHMKVMAPMTREMLWGIVAGMLLVEMGPERQNREDRKRLF